jgi:hypothetical protein
MKTPFFFSTSSRFQANVIGFHQSRGMILLTVLVMLVSIAVFSITGMQTIVINHRMASNAFEVSKKDQLAESAGKLAIEQGQWVNKALINLAANGNAPLKTLSRQTPVYSLEQFARNLVGAPKVDAQLLARSFAPLGSSAGVVSGIGGKVVEVYGAASDPNTGANGNSAKQTIVQGYVIIGAQ